ncbi:sacsin-like, partial [Clarias magur]
MSSSAKSSKEYEFKATAPQFTDYLKEILRRYADGGVILKELIQNADDAKASRIMFIYDERSYDMDSLWSTAKRKHSGPAVYAFNNAVFTEKDWEGIQQAGRSIKANDPNTIGRLGMGFSSVYHITVFDPQKLMFDDCEGYRCPLENEEGRNQLLKFTEQFKDIVSLVLKDSNAVENIIRDQEFKGTLFWFPLRQEASKISNNLYDFKKATQLFDIFFQDAEISVLFLKYITSITWWHIDLDGSVNVMNEVSVSHEPDPFQADEEFNLKRKHMQSKTSFKKLTAKNMTTKWLVTACQLMEGRVPEIDTLAGKLSFYPQVDVAFQCDEDRACDGGRLSCFLPLPNNETNRTGLPVHINASFGLTDDRQYIKWQEEQRNDDLAEYNELLIKKVLPYVYLKIIQDGILLSKKSMLPVNSVYRVWPDLRQTEHRPRWHEIAINLYKRLIQKQENFSLAKNEKTWVAATDAVFPIENTDKNSAILQLLIQKGENLVLVPEHVLVSINKTFPNPDTLKWVTPSLVRSVLHRSEIESISKDGKLSILEYVLSDGKYGELKGLQLLPLSDGSFRSFTNQEDDTALIDNENFSRLLLPFCKDKFLPHDLSNSTVKHLREIAMTNSKMYQLFNLDANNVAAFAKKHIPRDWKETTGHVKWNSQKHDHPPKTWLKEFWKFLNTHWTDLREFIGMPLIPLEPLQQASTVMLARLEEKCTLIFQSSRESTLPDQIQKVVKAIGGSVIKKDECLKHHDIESYVLKPSPRNILQLISTVGKHKVISAIVSASIHEKEEFINYMSFLDHLSDVEKDLLSALPIFRLFPETYVAIGSKQAVILKSIPAIPKDLPVPDTIVQCANEADRRLLTLLKVELLDAAQLASYLVDCIDAMRFTKEDEQKTMTWILNHGHMLFSQSEELLRKTKSLSFIQTDQGERKRPSSVFDPTNKTFVDLFEEDFFPPKVYSDDMLDNLKQDKKKFYVIHEELIGGEEEQEGIEQGGQTEPITQRIRNILKEYEDESNIFKELIQNAEDA